MQARDAMTRPVTSIEADANGPHRQWLMLQKRISGLPVRRAYALNALIFLVPVALD
jgi:CBS-domain-containing membrane protein